MHQLGLIVRLRRQLAVNRLGVVDRRRRRSALLFILGSAVAIVAGGHVAAPTLMEPPVDLATPRGLSPGDLPAGMMALEASFWLTALLASVLNFRVLELLFRRPDIVALQPLPIEAGALFSDRLAAATTEAVVTAAAASLFFVPLVWHGGTAVAAASVAMLFGGLLFGTAVSLLVMVLATQRLIPESADSERPSVTDSYGGPGQLLLYAPAVALGGIVVVALFWKLLLGEPIRPGGSMTLFWSGTAILGATIAAALVVCYRAFVDDYYQMAPRFHEIDAADFSAVADYQTSSFDTTRASEAGLDNEMRSAVRAMLLDDDRRMAGSRVGYAVVLILAIVGLATVEFDALPLWGAAMVPAILTAAIVNPWYRLYERVRCLDTPLALPVSAAGRQTAVDRLALREFLFIGGPYAAVAAVILGYFRDFGTDGLLVGGCALAAGIGLAGALSIGRRLGAEGLAIRVLPAAVVIGLTACAIASLTVATVVSLVIGTVALLLSFRSRSRHVHQ